ncbi:MAG TPA: hypothetical protein VEF33_14005 [Syntrophales bacterium]|nr:hypothetical protein [Syntrophales bacterium]
MKVLIHDDRPDAPEFLLEVITNRGYKAAYAKDSHEIINMLSSSQYEVILANGGYGELNANQYSQLKTSSVFVIGVKNSHKQILDTYLKADIYLQRPFLISELWRELKRPLQH